MNDKKSHLRIATSNFPTSISFYRESIGLEFRYLSFLSFAKRLDTNLRDKNSSLENTILLSKILSWDNSMSKIGGLTEDLRRYIRISSYMLNLNDSPTIEEFEKSKKASVIFCRENSPKIILYLDREFPKRLFFYGNDLSENEFKTLNRFDWGGNSKTISKSAPFPFVQKLFEAKYF